MIKIIKDSIYAKKIKDYDSYSIVVINAQRIRPLLPDKIIPEF